MAGKAKAPARKTAKTAAKKVVKAPKPAAKPVKKPAAKPAKPIAKKAVVAKKPVKPAAPSKGAKPAKPAPAKVVSAKSAPVKVAPKQASAPNVSIKLPARPPVRQSAKPAPVPRAGAVNFAPPPINAPMPSPRALPPRPQPVSQHDVAAAHEYLLTRSATRSEEPVIVNGKKLPTEEQLLKMSDGQYMNEEQLAFFKYRLQQMERELLANAGETTEHLRETVIVPDPADRATIEEEHALELRTRDRERKLIKKVQQSLTRIDSGDYGFCEETGEPIGIPRLLARPTATLSLEAQQRREMKQKLYGD
jgi:DnaK suppressor protein